MGSARRRALVAGMAGLGLVARAGWAAAPPPLRRLRIALPDASTGARSSSGTATGDLLYTRRLLEQEFAADGVEVRWAFFKNAGPAINEAFANEQVDVALLGDLASIIGEAAGNRTRVLAAAARRINGYLAVVPGRGYDGLAALRGKTIGVWLGTAAQLSLESILAREGFSPRDFRLINLDGGAALASLAAGRVDAIWTAAGALALRAKGLAQIPLSTVGGDGAGTIALSLLAAQSFIDRYPDATGRIVRTAVRAAHWSSEPSNADAVTDLLATQIGFPRALLQQELQGQPLARRNSPLLDAFFLGHLRHGVEAARREKLIRRPFDVQDWVEPRFLGAALKSLPLQGYWEEQAAYASV